VEEAELQALQAQTQIHGGGASPGRIFFGGLSKTRSKASQRAKSAEPDGVDDGGGGRAHSSTAAAGASSAAGVGAPPPAAPPPAPAVRAKVHLIFTALDEDQDSALNYTELRQLAVRRLAAPKIFILMRLRAGLTEIHLRVHRRRPAPPSRGHGHGLSHCRSLRMWPHT
jgi:hypothetical protein